MFAKVDEDVSCESTINQSVILSYSFISPEEEQREREAEQDHHEKQRSRASPYKGLCGLSIMWDQSGQPT